MQDTNWVGIRNELMQELTNELMRHVPQAEAAADSVAETRIVADTLIDPDSEDSVNVVETRIVADTLIDPDSEEEDPWDLGGWADEDMLASQESAAELN